MLQFAQEMNYDLYGNFENVTKLMSMCEEISSCRWSGDSKGVKKKFTAYTTDAFIVTPGPVAEPGSEENFSWGAKKI